MATFFRQFSDEENKTKSKQIGQEKVALTITGAGVVARKLTFSNIISELLDGAPPAPRWLFDYITVTSHQSLACRVHWSWAAVDRTGNTVKQSQRRVTSPTSKMFRQHLKCSLTAPRHAGKSFGFVFFLFVCFHSASCLSLGDLVQRCLGQPVDVLSPWPSAAVIPRRRSTAVHLQSVECRVQRNLEGLASVRFDPDELPGCRAATLTFIFLMITRRRWRGEREDKILRWRHSNCTHYDMHAEERQHECSQRRSEVRAGGLSSRFRLRAYRTVQTRPVSSRSVHHRIFPDVYFYTNPSAAARTAPNGVKERASFCLVFFVAWTQRRLTECFPLATEGPNPPKETLTFKKESFWQTTSGSLPAGLKCLEAKCREKP